MPNLSKKHSYPSNLILSLGVDTLQVLQTLPKLALLAGRPTLIVLPSRLLLDLTLPISTLVAIFIFRPPCEALCVRLIEGVEDRLDGIENVVCLDAGVSTLSGADLVEEDVSAGARHLHFGDVLASGYGL